MDAVIAALGAGEAWGRWDAEVIARHERYSREGLVFY
jgi:hypothetical protein